MGRCAQTWTWTGLTRHQREASFTACSEERQVLVLRQLSEGVGAKVLALFLLSFLPFFSSRPCPNSTCENCCFQLCRSPVTVDSNKACLSVPRSSLLAFSVFATSAGPPWGIVSVEKLVCGKILWCIRNCLSEVKNVWVTTGTTQLTGYFYCLCFLLPQPFILFCSFLNFLGMGWTLPLF